MLSQSHQTRKKGAYIKQRACAKINKIFASNNYVRKDKNNTYYREFCTFDIETTNIKKYRNSVVYLWSICVNGYVYFGRTLKEFTKLCNYINDHAQHKLVIYCHNFSFEFVFLSGVMDFGHDNVFLLDRRKPLKANYGMIEFRCSYLLTNMSLSKFTKNMGIKNAKLKGYNYNKYRLPWSKLTWLDYRYNGNDTLGLWQALVEFFKRNDDDIATIPMTNTGFVRRDLVEIFKSCMNDKLMESLQPNPELLTRLREAFRGGNTHNNRYFLGVVMQANKNCTTLKGVDEKSAYPAQLCSEKFPCTKFQHVGSKPLNVVENKIKSGLALLITISMWNVRQIDPLDGCPYIPVSKCNSYSNVVLDNGRILEADFICMTITDLDFRIIRQTYCADFWEVNDMWQSHYKMLPIEFREYLLTLFEAKENLKHIDPYLYSKQKNKFNACYGVMVMNPCRRQFMWTNNQCQEKTLNMSKIFEQLVRKKFAPYQWGVWCTSWARFKLHNAYMEIIRQRNEEIAQGKTPTIEFLYCDTDSLKYTGDVDFSKFNDMIIKKDMETGAFITGNDGKPIYLGILEDDADMTQWCSLGAKKYIYRDRKDKKLHLTLSGVSKSGVSELSNNIRNFKQGFVFKKSSGLQATFNDDVHKVVKYQGHELEITPNIYLEKTTYTLNTTPEYDFAAEYAKNHKKEFLDVFKKYIESKRI